MDAKDKRNTADSVLLAATASLQAANLHKTAEVKVFTSACNH